MKINKHDKRSYILIAAVAAWMLIIFYFSAQPGKDSTQISSKIAQRLMDFFDWIFNGDSPSFIKDVILNGDHYVHKSGHAIEFAILGGLTASLFARLGIKKFHIIALAMCAVYAASDELHQLFVEGRAARVSDIVLDTVFAFASIIIVYFIKRRKIITR